LIFWKLVIPWHSIRRLEGLSSIWRNNHISMTTIRIDRISQALFDTLRIVYCQVWVKSWLFCLVFIWWIDFINIISHVLLFLKALDSTLSWVSYSKYSEFLVGIVLIFHVLNFSIHFISTFTRTSLATTLRWPSLILLAQLLVNAWDIQSIDFRLSHFIYDAFTNKDESNNEKKTSSS